MKKYLERLSSETIQFQGSRSTCLGIGERYEIHFVEISVDEDHVHFLV